LVIPSLALLVALPPFLRLGGGFWVSLRAAMVIAAECYGLVFSLLRYLGLRT